MLNQLSFLRQALILSLPLGLVACSSGSSNVSQEAPEQLITKNGSQIAIQYGGYITSLARGVDTKKTKMLRVIDRDIMQKPLPVMSPVRFFVTRFLCSI